MLSTHLRPLGDAFNTSYRPNLSFYHVVGWRVQHLLLAKPALLSYSWKRRCILFLLVLLMMEKDGRFVVGGYFFFFISTFSVIFFLCFNFNPCSFYFYFLFLALLFFFNSVFILFISDFFLDTFIKVSLILDFTILSEFMEISLDSYIIDEMLQKRIL